MNADSNPTRKRILKWTLITLTVLCLGTTTATVGLVWWMGKRSSTQVIARATARPSSLANWSPATFSSQTSDAVRRTSEKSWSVKGGRAFMNVRRKADETLELRFVYPFDFLSPETVTLVQTRWNLREIENQADALNITAEQIDAVKAVSPSTDMPVSTPDKEHLRSLFEEYLSAKDATAENALVEAVAELDQKYYQRTMERIDSIAERMQSILHQDQIAELSERHQKRSGSRSETRVNPAP